MVKDKTKAHSVREKWPRGWVVTDLPASRVIGKKTVGEAVSKKSGLEVNNGKVAAAKVVPDGLTKAAEGKDMSATEVVKPVQEVAPAAECVEGSATAGHAGEAVASGGTANESATGETTVGASDKPSKEATTSETANGSTTDEPAEKVGSEESIDVSEGEVAKESADGGAAKESEKESTDGETAKESADGEGTNEAARESADSETTKEASKESADGEAIKESAKESTDGEAAKESADGQGINEAARESADSETTKEASKESADGNTAKESIDSEAAKEDGGLAVQVFSGELATEATTGELVTEVAIGEAAAEIPIDEPAAGETAVTETVAGEPAGIAVSEPVAEVPVVVEPESPAVEGVIEMSAAGSRPDASAMEICAVDCPPSIEIDGMTDEMHGVPEAPSVASESITLESESDALFKGSGCGVSNDSEKEVSAVEAEPKESIVAVAEVEVQPEPLLTPVAIAGVTVGDVATELGMDETEVLDAKPGLDEAAGSELVALKSMAVSPAKFVEPQLPEEVATEFESQIGKEGLAEELRSPASTVEYVAEEEDKEPGRRDGDNNEAHWSEAEDRELLQRMASVLPPIDDMPYNERAKIIRWKHVAFGGRTGKDCRIRWNLVLKQIRPIKTMSELVSEAVTQMKIKADLENSARELLFKAELKKCKPKNVQAKAEKIMKQPVCVKVQPTSFPTFFDEMKPKLLSENPGMSKNELRKCIKKMFKDREGEKKCKERRVQESCEGDIRKLKEMRSASEPKRPRLEEPVVAETENLRNTIISSKEKDKRRPKSNKKKSAAKAK